MSDSPSVEAAWRSHRPYLVNLAYQMLGDVGEAEDVAQEAFLRLSRADPSQIDDVRAWLTVVAGRLCLDQMRSARARHEQPDESGALDVTPSREVDPADRVTLDDEVRTALLEVLRRLSPGERVAFVLHDVFQMPFEEIAETVGRPVGTCRQLARRARAKFAGASPAAARRHQRRRTSGRHRAVHHRVRQRRSASADRRSGSDRVGRRHDPRRLRPAAADQSRPGRGGTNLLRYLGHGATLVTGPVGEPVLLAFAERRLFAVLVLTVRDNLILKIEATVDPSAANRR